MNSPIIVFDLGKVLVDFDYSIAVRKIATRSGKSPSEVADALLLSSFIIDFEYGRLTRQEFFRGIQRVTGFNGTLQEFGSFFADIFSEIPQMIELHSSLSRRGFKTYIFSNTNDLAIEHIRRNFPFFGKFDDYIYSYEVRSMKPEPAIYKALEQVTGRRGKEIIYLDDRPENVAGGTARGWQAVLHETPEKSRSVVEKLLP